MALLMRGLRLFVRPIEASDHEAVGKFLTLQDRPAGLHFAHGLLGKLLGDIVAVVAFDLLPEAIRIDDILVARDLRKKRIGRVMVNEVERLAAKMDRGRVIVVDPREAQEFFRRVGFRSEGERWVRDVSP